MVIKAAHLSISYSKLIHDPIYVVLKKVILIIPVLAELFPYLLLLLLLLRYMQTVNDQVETRSSESLVPVMSLFYRLRH